MKGIILMHPCSGWVTSRLLVKTLIPKISKALARMPDDVTEENLASDIQKVLERLDEDMKLAAIDSVPPGIAPFTAETVSAHAPMISGSSALICIYDLRRRSLRTVQVGTSRAIRGDWDRLRRDFHVDVLVVEHNGLNDTEVEDMDMRHPGENLFRGSSLITRAFGYLQWKWDLDETNWLAEQGLCPPAPEGNISPPYMRATPDVGIHWPKLNDFVILASSGFWELMSNEDALHCVSTWLAWKRSGLPPPDLPEEPLESHEPKYRRVPPSLFVYEDLDNVSVCLIKNALGGRRRKQFLGNMSTCYPDCTLLRRDITVQVIFCRDPYITCGLFKDKF